MAIIWTKIKGLFFPLSFPYPLKSRLQNTDVKNSRWLYDLYTGLLDIYIKIVGLCYI